MKTEITGLIQEGGTVLGPIEATTRHMTIEISGTAGTITGAKNVSGRYDTYTDVDTYEFTGPVETFDIDVNTPGTIIMLKTTGTFVNAVLLTEG